MAYMTVGVVTEAEGPTASHRAGSVRFASTERRLPDAPEAPSPLEMLMASLTGCMNVVAWMVAREQNWPLRQITFEAEGFLDPRGLMGDPTVPSRLERVSLTVKVVADFDDATLDALRTAVERRCPVHNTFRAAGIALTEQWVRASA